MTDVVHDPLAGGKSLRPEATAATRSTSCGARTRAGSPCSKVAGWRTDHPGQGRCYLHGGRTPIKHGRYSTVQRATVRELFERFSGDEDPWNVAEELALVRALLHDFIDRHGQFVAALSAWYDTWEGRYIPLPEAEKKALVDALDEYENSLADLDDSDEERQRLELARSAVIFLTTPQDPKPRQVLDIADAVKHVDVISKIIYRVEQTRAAGAVSIEQLKRFFFAVERVIATRLSDQPELVQRIQEDLLSVHL
jgi:hypothetical protein